MLNTSWTDGQVIHGSDLDVITTQVNANTIASQIYFNVKSAAYAAVGDGTTDDTAAIQAALDAAGSAGGGLVYFPAGIYKITSALNLGANTHDFITFQGAGSGGIDTTTGGVSVIHQTSTTVNGITTADTQGLNINNLKIVGPGSGSGDGIHLAWTVNTNVFGCNMNDVVITNFGANGFSAQTLLMSHFRHVISAYNGSNGFYLYSNCTTLTFDSCWAPANASNGWYINDVGYSTWNSCGADGSNVGWIITGNGACCTLNACGAEQSTTDAMQIAGVYSLTVNGFLIIGNNRYGIHIYGNSQNVVLNGIFETANGGAVYSIFVEDPAFGTIMGGGTVSPRNLNLSTNTLDGINGLKSLNSTVNYMNSTNFIAAYTSTATATATTTMNVFSTQTQIWTGTTTQTIKLPTTFITPGYQYEFFNQSTGAITIQSSGANTILVMASGTHARFICNTTTPTTAGHWTYWYEGDIYTSGKSLTVDNSLELAGTDGTKMTFPSTSGTVVTQGSALGTPSSGTLTNCTFPTLNQNTTGSAAKWTTAHNVDGQSLDGTGDITVIAPGTHAATGKTTPVDADELPLVDSAASNVLKKLTWANLKATIKAYYDSLTTTLTNKSVDLATNTLTGTTAQFNTALSDNDFATLAGSETLTTKILTNPTITNYTESVVAIGTVTSSNTLSLTSGTVQTATLTASTACTFTMPTATAGKSFTLLLKQAAATGNGTATFTGVKWNSSGAPTITATAGKMDILTFVADGTSWYGSYSQGFTP